MWILFFLTHAWLYGSVLLPVVVLVRWGAGSWKRLHWLKRTRKQWILFWGGFGLVSTIVTSMLPWASFNAVPSFDSLRRSGVSGWQAIGVILLQIDSYSVFDWFQTSRYLFQEVAIYCGIAALGWWAYEWLRGEFSGLSKRLALEGYCFSLMLSAVVWGIANNIEFRRSPACYDCGFQRGIPFAFYQQEGFEHLGGLIGKGVVGDALVILLCGLLLHEAWTRLSKKRTPAAEAKLVR